MLPSWLSWLRSRSFTWAVDVEASEIWTKIENAEPLPEGRDDTLQVRFETSSFGSDVP